MANKRICVLGDYDSICGFTVLGMDIYPVTTAESAEETLNNLIQREYQVIFVTENYAKDLTHILDKYRVLPTPAIIPIPSVAGTTGFGVGYVKKAVEQAVGSDIIFGEE